MLTSSVSSNEGLDFRHSDSSNKGKPFAISAQCPENAYLNRVVWVCAPKTSELWVELVLWLESLHVDGLACQFPGVQIQERKGMFNLMSANRITGNS